METFDTFFEGDAVAFALKRHIPHGKNDKKLPVFLISKASDLGAK